MDELPVLSATPVERADAARNREKILCAAAELFDKHGASTVSMDDIAERAGVGKGTLFRRFGDRASLALAVLDETEARFQENLIRGEPPLGPGAAPCERLIAFGHALIDVYERNAELLAAAQAGPAWLRSSPYAAYRAHVAYLVGQVAPELDAGYAADAILAVLRADLLAEMTTERGLSTVEVKDQFAGLVRRMLHGPTT